MHFIRFPNEKNAVEAMELINSTLDDNSVNHSTREKWFVRFRSRNFSLQDDPRSGRKRKVLDKELQSLLDENSAQIQEELVEQGVTRQAISVRLHAIGKIQKEGIWIPHELSESNRMKPYNTAPSLLNCHERKNFLYKIVTGDEK